MGTVMHWLWLIVWPWAVLIGIAIYAFVQVLHREWVQSERSKVSTELRAAKERIKNLEAQLCDWQTRYKAEESRHQERIRELQERCQRLTVQHEAELEASKRAPLEKLLGLKGGG